MVNTYSNLLLCYIQLQNKIEAACENGKADKQLIQVVRMLLKAVQSAVAEFNNYNFFCDLEIKVNEDYQTLKKLYQDDRFKNK